uniref:Uncharacterized protein n=1 Tax=Triticum urartu TaxID=4572 RepID=A0A8R7R2H0_TRIUA
MRRIQSTSPALDVEDRSSSALGAEDQ